MHHEDRDAHQTMCEAVDSQVNWKPECKESWNRGPGWVGYKEDVRTYFGNDPIDYDLQGIEVFRPLTVKELMAKQAKQERAARLIEEAVIIATFLTVIIGLMFTPALWHWARTLWEAIHG